MIKLTKTQRAIYYFVGFVITVLILTLLFPNLNSAVQGLIFVVITALEECLLKFLKLKKFIIYI